MKRIFVSEFSWRLYVVLQLLFGALAIVWILGIFSGGHMPFKVEYEPIIEPVEIDVVKYAQAREICEILSNKDETYKSRSSTNVPDFSVGSSPREDCLRTLENTRFREAGEKWTGISFDISYFILLVLLCFPFFAVWVPSWLIQGWRQDRST